MFVQAYVAPNAVAAAPAKPPPPSEEDIKAAGGLRDLSF
jgi:hypothetical protein